MPPRPDLVNWRIDESEDDMRELPNSHSTVPRIAKKTVQANLPATVEHRPTLPAAPAHRKRKQALLRAAAAPMRSSVER